MSIRRKLGAFGERLAVARLQGLGYRILERNYRCQEGEIDIVAEEAGETVFVEVRSKRGEEFGSPEESLTPAKRERLLACAEAYLNEHPERPPQWRVDVVSVLLRKDGGLEEVKVIPNAIEAVG